jgi:hypothetical protein
MSQKKRVRVYQPGQMGNPMNSWFMQMGGIPQQPQQQDMGAQAMQYAQQMIMEGEDPNNVYDDLVNQGVPSQLAAQVIEQLMESMPPQPAYSQPSQEEAMYDQEVEEREEAVPDYLSLTGFDEDDEDDDFKKGGMTKNKFIKEYKKLKLGGQKPDEIPGIQSAGFLGTVQNETNNYKIQKEAEEMYSNPFAVNALSQFVYGGSLPKAQDGTITKADFDKYVKEQEERYKQLEQRYNQGYNQGYRNDPYLYGNPYGRGYGNVPTMFNPYGRRGPIIQKSPYLNNFPGADFQGMQLSNFKIDTENVERMKPFRFLGPKTKQTWSGEWTRNPQTGVTTPAAGTTSTTTPAASTNNTSNTTNKPAATSNVETPTVSVIPTASTTSPTIIPETPIEPVSNTSVTSPKEFGIEEPLLKPNLDFNSLSLPLFPEQDPKDYKMMMEEYQRNKQRNQRSENIINPAKTSPELPDTFKEYQLNDFINNNKDFFSNVGRMMQQGGYIFQPEGDVPERMTPILPNYGDLMAATPGLANPTIDDKFIMDDDIKNAYTVDIPAAWDTAMYGARSITGALDDNRMRRDSLANFMGMVTNGEEEFGQRGNYTVNQSANSSNFRPDLDGQIQYSQYGGQFELGEETEMTDEEIEKFLKGGGKLRFV